jgi:NAD(P)-dependent dehydrogenase (short-subunit alcohol dehydrogenase family)
MSPEVPARDPSLSISKPPLNGRVVAVTGASRGIGAGIAECLIAAGARVLGASRTRGGEMTDDRFAAGDAFAQIECDVTAPDAPAQILAGALAAFGRVDALVNNAGLLLEGPCWAQDDDDVDALLAVNLTAPFRLSQELARHWLARGEAGVVVNVCSIESQVAWADPPQAAYAASKGGLLALTRAQALELAPHGIRVVAVGPGVIATAMTPEPGATATAIPLGGRAGTPAEIGEVVAFLVSDAARYVTGEILYADGGYLLR